MELAFRRWREFLPPAILVFLSLIWGTSFILIKQGLKVFTPDEVGALRVSAAFVFILPYALLQLRRLQAKDFMNLFISGMMGVFIPAFLFATAQTRLPSAITGILNTLSPIFTMIVGAVFFGLRFGGFAIAGIVAGFAGAVILALTGTQGGIAGIHPFALLVVLACFLYGTNLNFIKFRVQHLNSAVIGSVSLLLIGPFAMAYLFGFSDFTNRLQSVEGAWTAAGYIVLLGCMSTAIAGMLFTLLVKYRSPLYASSVTYLMPVVSVMWGWMDNEHLLAGHLVGMMLILAGVWIANRR